MRLQKIKFLSEIEIGKRISFGSEYFNTMSSDMGHIWSKKDPHMLFSGYTLNMNKKMRQGI